MGKYQSETVHEFLGKVIQVLIDGHDQEIDGDSTAGVVSIYQQLRDLVDPNVRYTLHRAKHIAAKIVDIAPDHGETYDHNDIRELADEINGWN